MRYLSIILSLIWVTLTESYMGNLHLKSSLSSKYKNDKSNVRRNMFSGIVEEMGTVEELKIIPDMVLWDGSTGEGVELTVNSKVAVGDAYIGCSIAVNGVCLTAISFNDKQFTVGLAPETLRRSNLGVLKQGSRVNVERALKADSRNSGHFVQGHVDCTGSIIEKFSEGDSLWFKVKVPSTSIQYIVPKGFICIDGTSLTICEVNTEASWFTFMLVAHTQQYVIIPMKDIGDEVNIEVDVLAKMVERSLKGVYDNNSNSNNSNSGNNSNKSEEIEALNNKIARLEEITSNLMETTTSLMKEIKSGMEGLEEMKKRLRE